MTFSIVIASHGHERWKNLARRRAWPSAENQGAEVLVEHDPDGTRAEVRNRLTEQAKGDWIITLDADDELDPGYVTAMEDAFRHAVPPVENWGRQLLLTPAISFVRNGRRERPKFMPEVDLTEANWMVVGTAVPRSLLLEVGGWRTFTGSGVLNQWDDWDLWMRCVQAGAGIVKVPDAVYVAHVSPSPHYSRTPTISRLWWNEIRQANGIGG